MRALKARLYAEGKLFGCRCFDQGRDALQLPAAAGLVIGKFVERLVSFAKATASQA
jgi:hypothetical protein